MKKVVGLLVAVALALLPSYAQYRATFGSNGVLYGLNTDDEVWVISQYLDGRETVHHTYSGDVVVADSVVNPYEFYGKKRPVIGVKVSKYDFSGVTSLTLPNTIRTVEGIEGCAIETIDLPASLTEVPNLSGCPNLKELILPPTIRKVGVCLNNCPSLTHVHLGAGVYQVDRHAFDGSDALESVTVDEANAALAIVDNVLYNKSMTHLDFCFPWNKEKVIDIPQTVTFIDSEAFRGCEGIEEVTVPEGIETLWMGVFRDCVNLRKVSLPESLKEISHYVFLGCRSLEEVNIPSSVESIGIDAFENCTSLTRLELPDRLSEIMIRAFLGCENLDLDIPQSVQSIGWAAFANCKKLSKVVLPESIEEIGDSTFYNCSGLSDLTVKGKISSVGEFAFAYCSSMKELNLDNFVGDIERYAFAGWGLDSLEIPESISRYQSSALSLYDSLKVARIADTNKTLDADNGPLFFGCNNLRSLYVGRPTSSGLFLELPALTDLTFGSFVYDASDMIWSECGNIKTVTCMSTTPPEAGMSTFSAVTLLRGVLRVPASAEEAYRNTLPWSAFEVIETFPDVVPAELRFNGADSVAMIPSTNLSLSVAVYPEQANFDRLTWKSSNEEVATVNKDGVVHSNKEGETDITVSTSSGLSATCHVSVRYVSGVEEVEAEPVLLYPNPVNDLLHIEGATPEATVALYDMTGRLVLSTQACEGVTVLDMAGFKPGVYLCRIQNKSYKIVKR